MSRRKSTARRFGALHRLLGGPGNRRLQHRAEVRDTEAVAPAKAPPSVSPSGGFRRRVARALSRLLQLALLALKVAVLGVLALAVAFGGYYTYNRVTTSDYFHVTQIEVVSARRASSEEIQALLENARGKNLLALDLAVLRRAALAHPWLRQVELERRLPDTLRVRVTEHKARALLLIGHLYLVNEDGRVFKRATPAEQQGMPVITGLSRLAYLDNPAVATARVRGALNALDRYYSRARPPLSEIHLDERGEISLFLQRGGVAVRVGRELTEEQLAKMDAVWAALGPEARLARVLFLDNEARTDRVTVRMGGY